MRGFVPLRFARVDGPGAGLVKSVRDERRLRAKRECVFGTCRACHSGLPTLTTLVLLCLPVDRFCLAAL